MARSQVRNLPALDGVRFLFDRLG